MKNYLLALATLALATWQCAPRNDTFNFPVEAPNTTPHGDHHEGHGHDGTAPATGTFGAAFSPDGAQSVSALPSILNQKDSVVAVFEGTIAEVCQKKGCWMTLDMGNGQVVRVTFKDYGFFVPKNAGGRKAILKGVASKEIISVEMLKHYAQDRGASKEEIEAIREPETEWSIVAEGVIIE
ncbi:MAG: DUF4920 domain-containing protein [Flavobacteriales bacterium]|nr:DUF4920 domain-containing protein [Flavobacteriales bacterium]MCX7650310.1 DUF4920 domain-containing protein [Flavobacteriales bacterium]MDW8432082.1 DUF4920 domain-containing protein [Flavobacteriales bacterium]